jgi:hypothetical protein
MTRVISDEIGGTLEDILQQMHNVYDPDAKEEDKINFSFSQWQYLVTQLFHDEVLIMALNSTILGARDKGINLNRNKSFLDYVLLHITSELKTEIKRGQHPIADLSFKNRVGGKKHRETSTRKGESLSW